MKVKSGAAKHHGGRVERVMGDVGIQKRGIL
jgi:class 3 adenylate cyclase